MDDKEQRLLEEATQAGVDSFTATIGHVPDQFALLRKYAPGTFAGYGLLRHALMQEPPQGALDMKTKELVFTGLSTLYGDKFGAEAHAGAALRLGATLEQIGEVMTQVIMVGGITAWNVCGYDVMRACEKAAEAPA